MGVVGVLNEGSLRSRGVLEDSTGETARVDIDDTLIYEVIVLSTVLAIEDIVQRRPSGMWSGEKRGKRWDKGNKIGDDG